MLRTRRVSPVVVGGLLVALGGVGLVACNSTSTAPAKPLTAAEILAKPEHSGLTDAHFTVTSAFPVATGITVDATGDGVLVYKPQPAARISFHATANGQTLTVEVRTVGGNDYTMVTPGAGKWTSSAATSNPATLSDSTEATLVGEDNLPQGKAWHVKAKDKDGNSIEVWVRESDGYPLRYDTKQSSGSGNASLTFDKYNTGETVTAPPASQIG